MLSKCEGNSILSIPSREKLSTHQATAGRSFSGESASPPLKDKSLKIVLSRGKERRCFSFIFLVFLFLNDQIN